MKINKKNLVKLVILVIALIIPIHDFINIIVETLNGFTIGLTYYGILVNLVCIFTAQTIIDDLEIKGE